MTKKSGNFQVHSNEEAEIAKKNLKKILQKIDNLGLIKRSLKLCQAHSQLKSSSFFFRINVKSILVIFFLSWICYYIGNNFIEGSRFQKCLMGTPEIFSKIFRPAENCSVCRDIQQVEKLADVDPEVFEDRYAYSGRPVVITDATKNWSAMKTISFSFFKSLYKDDNANCQFFPYKSGFKSLQDVFNMSLDRAILKPGTEPWYIGWSNCDGKIGSILRQHYHRPYFIPTTAESEKTDWIFMGSPGYGAPMHVDDVSYPSWQAQIKGSKLWTLDPPRECHYICNRLQVVVEPGEIIILDTNRWYHQTTIISDSLSITIGAEYD